MIWSFRLPRPLLAILLLFAAPALAAEPSDAGEKLHVRAGRARYSFARGEGVAADSLERATILADVRRGADRWMLVTHWEPSNPANPNGNCGGGRETFLAWLHVRANTAVAVQSERYDSCRQGIEGGRPAWSGPLCSVAFRRADPDSSPAEPAWVRTLVLFDRRAPEKGLQVSRQPPAKPD